jgi:hypothetical protein
LTVAPAAAAASPPPASSFAGLTLAERRTFRARLRLAKSFFLG